MADKNYRHYASDGSGRPNPYDALRSELSGSDEGAFRAPGESSGRSHAVESSYNRRTKPSAPHKRNAGGRPSGSAKTPVSRGQRALRKRIILLSSLIVVLLSVLLSVYAIFCVRDVLAIGVEEESARVEIPEGATTSQIIDILEDNGLIRNGLFCKLFAQFRGFEDNYVGGVYTVESNLGVEEMLRLFKEKPASAETRQVTIPEGWTVDQIVTRLNEMGICSSESLYDALENTDYSSYPFIAALQDQDLNGRYYLLEGYLFPDTYEFYVDSNPNDVIKKFLDNYESRISELDINRAQELGRTWDEIMVIASIIEREAGSADQMADVSAVIYNRLNDTSGLYPLLQMDSTSAYYDNYIEPRVTDAAQKALYKRSYDTYDSACLGLPKGPICNPSLKAIEAALNPTPNSPYYFFYHDKNGKIYLARTDQEHEANKAKANGSSNG